MPQPDTDWEGQRASVPPEYEEMARDDLDGSVRLRAYARWLRAKGFNFEEAKSWYERNRDNMQTMWQGSEFWRQLSHSLKDLNVSYRHEHQNYLLLQKDTAPDLETKQFESILLKTLRKNVSRNWPGPPDGGWLLPPMWFLYISDIVRTRFVVLHIDGVQYLMDHIQSLAKHCNSVRLKCSPPDYKAGMVGYYAAHVDLSMKRFPLELPGAISDTRRRLADWPPVQAPDRAPVQAPDWPPGYHREPGARTEFPKTVTAKLEIQVTTQLQEVVQGVMHDEYEVSRLKKVGIPELRDSTMPWDYTSEQFSISYLGHVLRYVEGMIVQARMRREQKRHDLEMLSGKEAEQRRRRLQAREEKR